MIWHDFGEHFHFAAATASRPDDDTRNEVARERIYLFIFSFATSLFVHSFIQNEFSYRNDFSFILSSSSSFCIVLVRQMKIISRGKTINNDDVKYLNHTHKHTTREMEGREREGSSRGRKKLLNWIKTISHSFVRLSSIFRRCCVLSCCFSVLSFIFFSLSPSPPFSICHSVGVYFHCFEFYSR